MLEIKKINKTYITGNFTQKALDNVSIIFRENEFVSILGPSGSGKTTLLNIIGGLDHYDSGDLVINGISTKKYKDKDWDTYRNHRIGFVFQSYNLIPHQSILANVELALTLAGISKSERKKRAKEALKKVDLINHINKRPNQLSGGQMQRVAIARALVNNPDILLADEPTGALDSKTSTQIMNLLKEIAKDKLVIMVTHNADLAKEYSNRIIELKDGKIMSDTNPCLNGENNVGTEKQKKTNMNFKTALSLSLNNLLTKKGRTILTCIAGSIGIIGIALIMSLSNGVQSYINRVEEEALTAYPLTIDSATIDLGTAISESMEKQKEKNKDFDKNKIYSNDTMMDMMSLMSSKVKSNNLKKFKEYLDDKDNDINDYLSAISYEYDLQLQLYKDSSEVVQVNPSTVFDSIGFKMDNNNSYSQFMISDVFMKMIDNSKLNNKLYEVVKGRMPDAYNEVVLLVDSNNRISDYTLYALGLKDQKELKDAYDAITKGEEIKTNPMEFSLDDLIGLKFKLLLNTDYYQKSNGLWFNKKDDEKYVKKMLKSAEELVVVGIIKPNEDSTLKNDMMGNVLYSKKLEEYVINKINSSKIVKEQKDNPKINILTNMKYNPNGEFNINNLSASQKAYIASLSPEDLADLITKYKEEASSTYESTLRKLGAVNFDEPSRINMYAKDFNSKDMLKNKIADYNSKQEIEADKIDYSDLVGILMSSVTSIVDIISYVLISFVSISLVVSSIMIGIITYISVLERTKEIGILRSIGASKKDISRVFNAETLIVGFASGLIGIGVTVLLNIPISKIIESLTNAGTLCKLPFLGGVILVAISTVLTIIAGLIPAKMASKKDPVEALRME